MISDQVGPIAKLDKIQFVSALPKTRSGKIVRRILRKIAEGKDDNFGDTSTLINPEIIEEIIKERIYIIKSRAKRQGSFIFVNLCR